MNSYYDALVYVATSLSVGYGDTYAKTRAGKTIGTALMTFGPSMANGLLNLPSKEKKDEATRDAIVERLDRIVAALEATGRT